MQYLIGAVIGFVISVVLQWILLNRDGFLNVYHTEDGVYMSLEINSIRRVEKPFIFLKVKHYGDTH